MCLWSIKVQFLGLTVKQYFIIFAFWLFSIPLFKNGSGQCHWMVMNNYHQGLFSLIIAILVLAWCTLTHLNSVRRCVQKEIGHLHYNRLNAGFLPALLREKGTLLLCTCHFIILLLSHQPLSFTMCASVCFGLKKWYFKCCWRLSLLPLRGVAINHFCELFEGLL